MDNFLDNIELKHPLVARKIKLASDQLASATSIEEYQQIGILIRDAWIEFAQLLFSTGMVPEGKKQPGSSDVDAMLGYIMGQWNECPKTLRQLVKKLFNLSMEIQHDRGVSEISPLWCISITAMAMSLMLDLDSQHNKLADRMYYKCPKCGSIDISVDRGQEVDPMDGPLWHYENWACQVCDWYHNLILD